MWDPERTTWDAQALQLLEAFQSYEDGLCSSCGQSAIHALDVANTREFSAGTVQCLGCEAREALQANNDHHIKGEKTYVINNMGKGGDDDG